MQRFIEYRNKQTWYLRRMPYIKPKMKTEYKCIGKNLTYFLMWHVKRTSSGTGKRPWLLRVTILDNDFQRSDGQCVQALTDPVPLTSVMLRVAFFFQCHMIICSCSLITDNIDSDKYMRQKKEKGVTDLGLNNCERLKIRIFCWTKYERETFSWNTMWETENYLPCG